VTLPDRLPRIGMVARWKPVHLGHAAALEAILARADETLIGLGSTNRYDAQNPWSPEETEAMLERVLGPRTGYRLLRVPDLGHPARWRKMALDLFGPLDLFVTANPLVRDLLRHDYQIAHPVWLIPAEKRVAVDGTLVRREIARGGEAWRALVPEAVADYLDQAGLVERFRREFGAATLEAGGRSPVD
jgi:nicotinamide-nucleotide adenylyltransferase